MNTGTFQAILHIQASNNNNAPELSAASVNSAVSAFALSPAPTAAPTVSPADHAHSNANTILIAIIVVVAVVGCVGLTWLISLSYFLCLRSSVAAVDPFATPKVAPAKVCPQDHDIEMMPTGSFPLSPSSEENGIVVPNAQVFAHY